MRHTLILASLLLTAAATQLAAQFVYAANLSSPNTSAYRMDPVGGALAPVAGSPFPAGDMAILLAADPSGRFLYVTNQTEGTVSGYVIDPISGVLKPIAGSPFPAGNGAQGITFDISGRFLYVANSTAPFSISRYRVNSYSGVLTPLGTPVPSPIEVDVLKAHPSGRFLYATNNVAGSVTGYTIDSVSGALTQIAGSPFQTGNGPYALDTDPSGRFLYVGNFVGNSISAFRVNAVSGVLSPIANSPFSTPSPNDVKVDPSGRFLYVTPGTNKVSVYAIDAGSGGLSLVGTYPIPGGSSSIEDIAVDRSGRFVYFTDQNTNQIFAARSDPSTGALTPLTSGFPVVTGAEPFGIIIVRPAITNYKLVGSLAGSGGHVTLTYQADYANNGPAIGPVTATLTSLDPYHIRVVPGQDTLRFPSVAANGQVTATNTFSIIVDSSVPLDGNNLSWSFQIAPAGVVANPGQDQTVSAGSNVMLDGSGSQNLSGTGTLTYNWKFISRPAGTMTRLFYENSAQATFTADVVGVYVLQLTVSNGKDTSTSTVKITVN